MSSENATSPSHGNEASVVFSKDGAIGHILLNRPKALNALDLPMVDAITAKLREWENDATVVAIVIEGAGEKAFCAGGDIRGLYDARKRDDDALLDAFYRREYYLNNYIATYPKPYIALMNGITMGGGVGVSVHGHFRVVTERTLFAMPETGIGFFPDVGGGYFLSRCPGQIGLYLGLTGARIKAADCLYADLATHNVNSENITALKSDLSAIEGGNDPFVAVKKVLDDHHVKGEEGLLNTLRTEIDKLFGADTVADIFAALDASSTDFAKETAKILRSKSPIAVCVTFEQIRQGRDMTLEQDLAMEFRLSQRTVRMPDLFEGVRAVIVDKDHSPKWQHADIGQVDPRDVAAYFDLLPEDKELKLQF
ncbi:enoyl-CoA hydratase/isomerase family protein [Thalassospira sp. A3_1]|uniref:enoyl-CoA hydratase/isomerase family protein n=1 Tax=Thalassospira sp. A3_1 TaxID=2821088 RepID=UPI001ADD4565|nr:enoyl-CoA hydratase/isomerase family protein [Thalassospira sp. A3_1]MBO9508729.1 enoyl-CoA hydratase/isomerase family protein [Thalassospira sp. A3_1]